MNDRTNGSVAFEKSIRTQQPASGAAVRLERDTLGEVEIPADVYWGVHTARALSNFAISGRPIGEYPDFIHAYLCVKQAAARANAEIGSLDPTRASLIDAAAEDLKDGDLIDQFVVDIMQGGAGTLTNMNVNEVLANRALVMGGYQLGEYQFLCPLDDVNRSQSTNDTYPTALKLALQIAVDRLLLETDLLCDAFDAKGREFAGVLKVGRTQLQDAVPMTLGQEFSGFGITLREDGEFLRSTFPALSEINLGATAIGTGIASDPRYAEAVRKHLASITGLVLRTSEHLVAATTDMGVFMQVSGTLKRFAVKLSKICNDLRLLSSGPQYGLGEINLPPRQAGWSIMPGKVNPVICEAVNQVAFAAIGADVVVTVASEAGQLQLNAFGPVVAHALLGSIKWLTASVVTLRTNCIDGITANSERLERQMESFAGIMTAFTPYIGYAAAGELAKEAIRSNARIADLIVGADLMNAADVAVIMEPARLAGEDRSIPRLRRPYPAVVEQHQPRE